MSVLQKNQEKMSEEIQIWDNATFENAKFEGSIAMKFPWSDMNPLSINSSLSVNSDSTKENQNPSMVGSQVSINSGSPVKPMSEVGFLDQKNSGNVDEGCLGKENVSHERNVDLEIMEIEKEISRLTLRLGSLRFEKEKRNAKLNVNQGKIVAAKFMDPPKKCVNSFNERNKLEGLSSMSAKSKTPRRGLSMGPAEITRGTRRGISLGPGEIYSSTKLKQLSKQEITTPIQPALSRRKSCFWKLQGIDELKETKERGKAMSPSPQSRSKKVSKLHDQKQAATTTGSRKTVRKDGVISSIQPKKLFVKEDEKSAPVKKPLKCGRVVASRYSQISIGPASAMKEPMKRSLPENEETCKKVDKKCDSLSVKLQGVEKPKLETRLNKQHETPNEVGVLKDLDHKTPLSVSKKLDMVPKIKILSCKNESPRDSGPAKRVSELIGRKPYFDMDEVDKETMKDSVCQALDFEEQISGEYKKIWVLRCRNKNPLDSSATEGVSQLVERPFVFDDDNEMPVFSFEEEDDEN